MFVECPCSDEDDYRMEVLINLRRVERLDKDEYNDEERQEAEDLYEQRRAEELAAEVRNKMGCLYTNMNRLANKVQLLVYWSQGSAISSLITIRVSN